MTGATRVFVMCHCKVEGGRWGVCEEGLRDRVGRWGGGKKLKKKNAPAGKSPYGLIYRKVRPLFILFFCVALLVVVTTSAPRGRREHGVVDDLWGPGRTGDGGGLGARGLGRKSAGSCKAGEIACREARCPALPRVGTFVSEALYLRGPALTNQPSVGRQHMARFGLGTCAL